MKSKIIEGVSMDSLYLKAIVSRFDKADWERRSIVNRQIGVEYSLLRQEGWSEDHFLIQDISSPGPGGIFKMGGHAQYDLEKSPTRF